jgi:thiamine-monophosphate kinase
MPGAEFDRIAGLRRRLSDPPGVIVGVGDDTAVLDRRDWSAELITVDMLVEGIHFDLARASLEQVGRKALAVNLSDIAAMAGTPTEAVAAVGLRPGLPDDAFERIFDGLKRLADEFGVALVGGDTNRAPALVLSITLLGLPTGAGPVLRSGGRPGDQLFVTGPLGGSLSSGRHLDFPPRVREARRLHERVALRAMMDLSDGLGGDLFRLTEASGVGAVLVAAAIPRNPGCDLAAALNDGEDFELLFAVSPDDAVRIERDQPLAEFGLAPTRIGELTREREVRIRQGDGRLEALAPGGWIHDV